MNPYLHKVKNTHDKKMTTTGQLLKIRFRRAINGTFVATVGEKTYAGHVGFNPIRTELIPVEAAALTADWTAMIIDFNSLTPPPH